MILALVLAAGLPSVDPGVRELPTCRLNGISFRTPTEGWVMTACGAVYRTKDAGRGWTRDAVLEKQFLSGDPTQAWREGQLGFLRWVTPAIGFAGGYIGARVFRTTDAGASWAEVRLPGDQWVYSTFVRGKTAWACGSTGEIFRSDDAGAQWKKAASPFDSNDRCMSLAFRADRTGETTGMNQSRWRTTDDGATWTNVEPAKVGQFGLPHLDAAGAQDEMKSVAGPLTASIRDEALVFEEQGRPKRAGPLRTPTTGERVPLLGVETREGGRFGWTETALFLTHDDGETWTRVGDLPAAPSRLTFVSRDAVVLEAGAVAWRSERQGRDWKKSDQPVIDRADADRARGKTASASPIACLETARGGELHVTLGTQGCFGGSERTARFTLHEQLPVAVQTNEKTDFLPRAKLNDLVRGIGVRIARLEQPMGCTSTTMNSAEVRWTCDGSAWQSVRFESHGCGSSEGVGASTSFHSGPETGYARAIGLGELIRQTVTW